MLWAGHHSSINTYYHYVKCVRIRSCLVRFQSKYGKTWTKITPNVDTFHAVCSFYDQRNNSTCYYKCLWRKKKPCCFWVIPTKRKRGFKKVVEQASRCSQRIAGKAVEPLSVIVGSVVGEILSFLGKVLDFLLNIHEF